jgi:hypothetical protein
VERIWENVRDWEHLPWLHRSSFRSVELLEQTSTLWRARITMPPVDAPREAIIELQMDIPNQRYWSRTLEGQGTGGEILTILTPSGEHTTDILVEFRALVSSVEAAETLGKAIEKRGAASSVLIGATIAWSFPRVKKVSTRREHL